MSKYDEERKKILERMQQSNVSFASPSESKYASERSSGKSKYDDERRDLTNGITTKTINGEQVKMKSPKPIEMFQPGESINPLQGTMDSISNIAKQVKDQKKSDRKRLIDEGIKKIKSGPEPSDRPGRDIPIIGTAVRNLDAFADFTKPAADLMGQFYTPGGGLTAINAGYGAIRQGLGRILPNVARGTGMGQRVAREAITEATLSAPLTAGNVLAQNPGVSGKEFAQQTAIGTGLGAVTGAAAPLLGRALSKLFQRNGIPEQQVQEVLALPSPKQRGNRNVAPMVDEPIVTPYTFGLPEGQSPPRRVDVTPQEPLGLPSPRIEPPTRGRVEQRVNPYRQQFESLIGRARQLEADGKLTPGREDEDLRSLWSQMAGKEAPSLDELIDLAYNPRPNRINPNLANQARQTQFSREVAGAPLPVKSSSERYVQGPLANVDAPVTVPKGVPQPRYGVFDQAASPQTIPGRAPGVASQPEVLNANVVPARPRVDVTPEPTPNPTQRVDDAADDIQLPEPDEVAPRVRDRVTSFADDLIKSAQEELAKSRNRLSSNPVDVYTQYAKIGAGHMLKGTVKLADFTEQMVRDFGEEIRPHVRKIFQQSKEAYKQIQKQIESEELGLNGFEAQELKDLTNLNLNTADVYRNFRKVFGEHFPAIKKAVLDPFDAAKGDYASEQKIMTDKLFNEVVKGLGIRKGTKDSALVQRYGEGQISLEELKSQAPKTWNKIVQADMWFRNEYDRLIKRVNESVSSIYPNRPEKLVPRRADYYRHFQELKGWGGLTNLFDTTSAKISPGLSGLSPFTQPKSKWASFKQKRGMGEFTNDAVGGFLEYIPAASYAIHIDPHITTFRNLAKRLAVDTEQTANINNFIKFLNNFANDLSGKTSPIDRWVEEIGGRNALRILTKVNNRVKSNVILGNVRSTLSQLANIPNGVSYGGVDAPAGAIRTIQSIFVPNEGMAKSAFLRERYLDKSFRRFDQKILEQPRRFAEWMMETSDRVGTSFVWNTAHAKGVRQKVANPVKFADEQARRLVGGRGVGEQPLLIKSKIFNLVAPFQLEVNNLWRVMKDFTDEKRFGALATLFAANWLLNKAFEKATGSGVVFDPFDALYDAATDEDMNVLQRGGRIAGEVLSNVPFGQTLASLYPEYGTNLYGAELPSRKELFGEKDPTRFGSGLLATGAITDPLFKFVLPFGGNQLKKATQGIDALLRGGAYTENVLTTGKTIEGPKLKFPVESSPENIARGTLFGPYATTEGQAYTKNERRPLSERQTKTYQDSDDPAQNYQRLMESRRKETEKRKLQESKK